MSAADKFHRGILGPQHRSIDECKKIEYPEIPQIKTYQPFLVKVIDIQCHQILDRNGWSAGELQQRGSQDDFYTYKQRAALLSRKRKSEMLQGEEEHTYGLCVWLHCLGSEGTPVTLKVWNWKPYFYIAYDDELPADIDTLHQEALEIELKAHAQKQLDPDQRGDLHFSFEIKENAIYWQADSRGQTRRFRCLKVSCESTAALRRASEIALGVWKPSEHATPRKLSPLPSGQGKVYGVYEYDIFECKLTTKFSDTTDIVVSTLLEVDPRTSQLCGPHANLHTFDTYEFDVEDFSFLEIIADQDDRYPSGPFPIKGLRSAACDIECHNSRFLYQPDSNARSDHRDDPVTAISCVVADGSTTIGKYVFALAPTKSIEAQEKADMLSLADVWFDSHAEYTTLIDWPDRETTEYCVWWYHNEQTLIRAWRDFFVRVVNPVSNLWYNGFLFDLPRLCTRLALHSGGSIGRLDFLGRSPLIPCKLEENRTQKTNAKGHRRLMAIPGRWLIDMCLAARDSGVKLRQYRLKDACEHFLAKDPEARKIDLDYRTMDACWKLAWHETCDTRWKYNRYLQAFLTYNIFDSLLCTKLAYSSLQTHQSLMAMSQVVSTPVGDLLTKGLSNTCANLMINRGHRKGYVFNMSGAQLIPWPGCREVIEELRHKPRVWSKDGSAQEGVPQEKYAGGLVLKPVGGIHTDPTVCLDFMSLYPSLMMGFSACPSRLIHPLLIDHMRRAEVPLTEYHIPQPPDAKTGRTPPDHHIVLVGEGLGRGLLPLVEKELFAQRKAVKRQLGSAQKEIGALKKQHELTQQLVRARLIGLSSSFHDLSPFTCFYEFFFDLERDVSYAQCWEPLEEAGVFSRSQTQQVLSSGFEERCTLFSQNLENQIHNLQDLECTYDRRQLAIKVCMNSLYGVLGANFGVMRCKKIAELITYLGRKSNEETQEYVKELFPGAEVIYGDTDSVMVIFAETRGLAQKGPEGEVEALQKSFEMGEIAAEKISEKFKKSRLILECEKSYLPYIALKEGKKTYAGRKFMHPPKTIAELDTTSTTEIRGLKPVKRDTSKWTANVIKGVIEELFSSRREGALLHVHREIEKVRNNDVSFDDFVLTRSLKEDSHYNKTHPKSGNPLKPPVHVAVSRRVKERTPERAYEPGDRVPFIYTITPKGSAATPSEKAEEANYARAHNMKIDFAHYIEKELMTQLLKIVDVIVEDSNIDTFKMLLEAPVREMIKTRDRQSDLNSFFSTPKPANPAPSLSAMPTKRAAPLKKNRNPPIQTSTLNGFFAMKK